jgi:hypothetical protein
MEDLNSNFEAAKPLWTRFLEVKQNLSPQLHAFCDRGNSTTPSAENAINEIRANYDEFVKLNGILQSAWYAVDTIAPQCRACASKLDRPCAYIRPNEHVDKGGRLVELVQTGFAGAKALREQWRDAKQELLNDAVRGTPFALKVQRMIRAARSTILVIFLE